MDSKLQDLIKECQRNLSEAVLNNQPKFVASRRAKKGAEQKSTSKENDNCRTKRNKEYENFAW